MIQQFSFSDPLKRVSRGVGTTTARQDTKTNTALAAEQGIALPGDRVIDIYSISLTKPA